MLVHPGNAEGARCGTWGEHAGQGVLAVPYDIPHRPNTKREDALGTRLTPSLFRTLFLALGRRCAALFSPALPARTSIPLTPRQTNYPHPQVHPRFPLPAALLAGRSATGPARLPPGAGRRLRVLDYGTRRDGDGARARRGLSPGTRA